MVQANTSSDDERKFKEIIQKVETSQPLNDNELDFINSLSQLPPEFKEQVRIYDKRNKGENLTSNEQNFLQELQSRAGGGGLPELPLSPESKINKDEFELERRNNADGFQIHHLSDLHQRAEVLEQLLVQSLAEAGHLETDERGQILFNEGNKPVLKKNVPITLTGDIGTDFFDQQNHGLEAYLSDVIVEKGGFTAEEEEEFRSHYEFLMNKSGLDENMIKEMNPSAFAEGGPFAMFHSYLFGSQDPHFLTKKEKKEFKERKKKVQDLIKKGMRHHARREYGIIKDSFERLGFGPDKVAILSGNHDVPEIMKEVLGDYLVTPGQVKEVAGVKFGNMVDSANGNFTNGPDFNDVFGYAGLREELDEVRYKTDAHKKIKSLLNDDLGLDFDDRTIKRYTDISLQRAAQGVGAGHLGNIFKKDIEPILKEHLRTRIEALKDNIPYGADVILQHSMLDDPQRAGLEERAAHELIVKHLGPGTVVLHGHEHAPTPHRRDQIYHLNPGAGAAGNSAIHLLGEDKKYKSSLFKGTDNNMLDTYRYLNPRNIAGQASGRYQ